MTRPVAPRPFGRDAMAGKTFDEIVADLGVAHRARIALWHLVRSGPAAAPAIRHGLEHPDPAVRRGCCEILDLSWDADAANELVARLDDEDDGVRRMAAHALTCERCKNEDRWATRA